MSKKNLLKILAVSCLACILIFSMFACSGGQAISKYNLPKQYRNIIYYFEQGYYEDWTMAGNPDGKYSDESKDLVVTITDNNNPGAARYYVFKQKEHQDIPLTSSLKSIFALVTDPNHSLYYNTRMGVRDNFAITSSEPIDFILNGRQYYSATYTFTENGENWQGQFFVLPDSRQYYVVAYEAKVDSWATYEPKFKEMMNDFRPTGWESDNTIS